MIQGFGTANNAFIRYMFGNEHMVNSTCSNLWRMGDDQRLHMFTKAGKTFTTTSHVKVPTWYAKVREERGND